MKFLEVEQLNKRIALVTPLKNEAGNIDALFSAIESQRVRVSVWVIVENGSDDGSDAILRSKIIPSNVDKIEILNFSLPIETYALGVKYATVVNHGFQYLMSEISKGKLAAPDFVGILDADCFPSADYYEDLVSRMSRDAIDISSGVGVFDNGQPDGEAKDWVRGNCRLWTWRCFSDVGYVVGPSADTLSLTKAVIKGYVARPYLDILYHCREMGKKSRYDYYGYSSYFRGVPIFYALARSIKILLMGRFGNARDYLKGYMKSYIRKDPTIEDREIYDYFQSVVSRKIRSLFG